MGGSLIRGKNVATSRGNGSGVGGRDLITNCYPFPGCNMDFPRWLSVCFRCDYRARRQPYHPGVHTDTNPRCTDSNTDRSSPSDQLPGRETRAYYSNGNNWQEFTARIGIVYRIIKNISI